MYKWLRANSAQQEFSPLIRAHPILFSVPGATKLHTLISKLKKWIKIMEAKIKSLPRYSLPASCTSFTSRNCFFPKYCKSTILLGLFLCACVCVLLTQVLSTGGEVPLSQQLQHRHCRCGHSRRLSCAQGKRHLHRCTRTLHAHVRTHTHTHTQHTCTHTHTHTNTNTHTHTHTH